MFFGRNHNDHSAHDLIVDVGSGSVGVAVCDNFSQKSFPEILFTHRSYMRPRSRATSVEKLRDLQETLFSALLEFGDSGIKQLRVNNRSASIKAIRVFVASPWSQIITRLVHLHDDTPFVITNELIRKTIRKAEQALAPDHEAKSLEELGLEAVNRNLVGVYANGYRVHNPVGQVVEELKIAHLLECVPHAIVSMVKRAEKHMMPHAEMSIHTYAYTLYRIFRNQYPKNMHALLIDITGEATEVCVIEDGILFESYSMPHGALTMLREVADDMGTIPDEAAAHIRSFIAGESHPSADKAIAAASGHYERNLLKIIEKAREKYVLPRTIHITADPQVASFYGAIISRVIKNCLAGTPHIITVDPSLLKALASFKYGAQSDLYLGLEAAFLKMSATNKYELLLK